MHPSSPSPFLSSHAYASASNASGNRLMLYSSGPLFLKNCTYAPSTRTRPSWRLAMYSSRRSGVKPQFLLTMIFWRPGNLYWLRRRASTAVARSASHTGSVAVTSRLVLRVLTYENHGCGRRAGSGRCSRGRRGRWACRMHHACRFGDDRLRRTTTSC